MAQLGSIPEFTQDESQPVVPPVVEEVKEAPVETPIEPVKDTPEPPADKPAEQAPSVEHTDPVPQEPDRAVKALQEERVKLLKEISELRGQRREIKQEQLAKVEKQMDDLKDLHPQDVEVIDRVLRAKGFVNKEEASQMFYDSVKNEELKKFLDRYPEYKPENDPNDLNWSTLQNELALYKTPSDPHQVALLLERAHRTIAVTRPTDPLPAKKRAVAVASVGAGGVQRSSPPTTHLTPEQKQIYRQGGWSEEDIAKIETRIH